MWQFTNPQHSTDKEVLLELPNFPVGLLYVVWRYFFENKRSPKTFFNQLYTLLFNGVILSTKIPEKWYCTIYIFFRFVKRRFFLWVIKPAKDRQNRLYFKSEWFSKSLLTWSRYLFVLYGCIKEILFMTPSNNTMLQSEKWAPFVSPFADKRQNCRVCEAEFWPWSPLSRFNGIAFKLAAALLCKGRLR